VKLIQWKEVQLRTPTSLPDGGQVNADYLD